ncbi:MAG: fucose isomerase [Gammaproteobacteria bacterium]|nr:fucose isomerase [Gammaproteobacteria bacterium]
MKKKIAIFWPGDYRELPNKAAIPEITQSTEQLEKALKKLGYESYRIQGFITKPHEAIEKLSQINDPIIGMYAHWVYGPHTTDGVVGKNNPLLLVSNFSGTWPGLVGLLNTAACLEMVGRKCSRIWTDAVDWTSDKKFLERLKEWCETGQIKYRQDEISTKINITQKAQKIAQAIATAISKRRILALMLGDTSMGMINGYLGPRFLTPHGFTEHKVDQAWIIARGQKISSKRIEAAYNFVKEHGVVFHYHGKGAEDFDENATKEQLRDYLAVLDLVDEFKADCVGWQYQLGLIDLRPPSDFAEGLLNSACRPESNGEPIITATEADQGNLIPMELMKRILKAKKMPPCVMFHDVRWGKEYAGHFVWVLLNSGSCSAYAFNHDLNSLRGVHSYRQPRGYFKVPGGTFTGESLPGKITWARTYLKDNKLWMDIGIGEALKLPEQIRDELWKGTNSEWPFMAADLGISQETLMAHYLSNHIAVAYGDIFQELIALSQLLGFKVRILKAKR